MAEIKRLQGRLRSHLESTDAQVALLLKNLEKFLGDELDMIVSKLEIGELEGLDAAAALGGLISQLEDAGLDREVGRLRAIYGSELRFINEGFADLGFEKALTGVDRSVVDSLIQFDTDKITAHLKADAEDVKATLLRSVLSPEKVDLKAIVKDSVAASSSQVQTEVNTMLSAFSRTVTTTKAEELGLTLYIYLGPDDKITRKFCQKLLNKEPPIYTIEEIKTMDNGQDLPVLTYAGGYNCRHQWRPISEEKAKALGYGG